MKKIDSFINQYSISKTLQFSLIPQGKTLDNFTKKNVISEDSKRSEEYKKVKKIIDRYHKDYIDRVLGTLDEFDISEYKELYFKSNKTDNDKKKIEELESKYRKLISDKLTKNPEYKILFSKELITEALPEFVEKNEEKESVSEFDKFSTYFRGFYENRKNMYTDEEKSTGIAYRCINDNLPKFLENTRIYEQIKEQIDINALNSDFECLIGRRIDDFFDYNNFCIVIQASGIDRYNEIIGGYTTSDGKKIKGINEIINAYNQKNSKSGIRLPKMKFLYKQILSDRETISFIPETFDSDDDSEVLSQIKTYYTDNISAAVTEIENIFNELDLYNPDGIFLKNGPAVTNFSNRFFGNWNVIREKWNEEYDRGKKIKDYEKYSEKRNAEWKKKDSFSFKELQRYIDICGDADYNSVNEFYKTIINECSTKISSAYSEAEFLLSNTYNKKKRLSKNDDDIAVIKNLLDAIKELESFIKPILGTGKEENRDNVFYGSFEEWFAKFHDFDKFYDKVRNYITKKPYSKNKIKLNFNNPQFLGGWDRNKESDYSSVLLKKEQCYYLAIMDYAHRDYFKLNVDPKDSNDVASKIVYKQIPSASKYFSSKQINPQNPPENIKKYLHKDFDKKTMTKEQLTELIKYVAEDFIPNYPMLRDEDGNLYFDYKFKKYSEYDSWNDFMKDIEPQSYNLKYKDISWEYVIDGVEKGDVYLFRIYNKDFSPYSKGTPNLHTLYFKMLFDKENLENVVYKLNGGAEMFYRFPSIKDEEKIVHRKNQPIINKNPNNNKKESVFEYDIIKDKRFTEPQFSLHIPIELNFNAIGNERVNSNVRSELKKCEKNYVIGIDRGERHLLYITVVNDEGEIVEQFSANRIGIDDKRFVDYHKLLDEKERERNEARQKWTTIENIKELKEGYISQIVHKICQLVVKYDAVIAMENLSSGFKNSRCKVDKQVYQKFEKMLIDKLNYYVDKNKSPNENGGLLNAYQLTEKFESFKKMGNQNGFIFYVPAWLTSKIDPQTGFVDLLKPKYHSVENSVDFISRFEKIRFNESENYFEFSFDYENFPKGTTDFRKKWTICTNKDRILTERNTEEANGNYISKKIILTDEFVKLFEKYGIDYKSDNLKKLITEQDKKEFFERFMKLLRLTLQMRNSITGTEEDYLISPVMNSEGKFYDSREYDNDSKLPANADANGAYNIARKALWAIDAFKTTEEEKLMKSKISISNKEWLEYAQK